MRKIQAIKDQMKSLKQHKNHILGDTLYDNDAVIAIEGRIAALRWVLNEYELSDKYLNDRDGKPTIGNRGEIREVYRRPMRR
ncbi:hypothetical protein [Methanococcoides seepicolus]|jgi:hypothetical protein|uniref:Uncharacterized protein n=1 Tax=Methanococcoides seepicolus TaxID=2828780 RepID=A0A9E5DCE4_9EURY|nr:hypothetical protein [Methanococcoides seepicolus]MCM1987986.1 hypothetical protein [Methanococcoides seepicolus]